MTKISNDMSEMNKIVKGLKPLKTINIEIETNLINIICYESVLEIKIKALNDELNKECEERFSLDDIKKIKKNKYKILLKYLMRIS